MDNNACFQCGNRPVGGNYPHLRPTTDSYSFCTCMPPNRKGIMPPPGRPPLPAYGPFVGNGFSLINTNPYLVDTSTLSYGQLLIYSETVNTTVTRRADASCINLVAKFNMVNDTITNTVMNDFLNKYVAHNYETLQGVLPVLKSKIRFRIYYTITDFSGGVMTSDVMDLFTDDTHFHFTDVMDLFVTSSKGLIIKTIPAMTYGGEYTLTLDRVEAYLDYLDTIKYTTMGVNPFYQFTDNNMKIALQHETIEGYESDGSLLISSCNINQSFDYVANVNNRVKLSFTAFMGNLIAAPDTLDVWNALNTPTEEMVATLQSQVAELQSKLAADELLIQTLTSRLDALEGQVNLNKNNIASNTRDISIINIKNNEQDDRITNLENRVDVLESKPLALNKYQEGQHFVASQLTWNGYGNLYQSTKSFIADGDFETDVAAGNLVVVATDAAGIAPVVERVDILEEEVQDLQDKELEKNKVVIVNLNDNTKQYVNSYSDAATILNNDLNGSYRVYPGEGYTEASFADELFKNTTSLKQIVIPTSTTTFGRKVFENSGLTSLDIQNNITTIGTDMCYNCSDLTSVTIDSPTLELNSGAFMNCSNLTDINIVSVNKLQTSAFYNTGAETITVPASCVLINTGCFNKCSNLKTLTIGATELKDHMVNSSTQLESIELLDTVTTIDSTCFQGCPEPLIINIHKSEGSITGSPWGAGSGVTINWGVN